MPSSLPAPHGRVGSCSRAGRPSSPDAPSLRGPQTSRGKGRASRPCRTHTPVASAPKRADFAPGVNRNLWENPPRGGPWLTSPDSGNTSTSFPQLDNSRCRESAPASRCIAPTRESAAGQMRTPEPGFAKGGRTGLGRGRDFAALMSTGCCRRPLFEDTQVCLVPRPEEGRPSVTRCPHPVWPGRCALASVCTPESWVWHAPHPFSVPRPPWEMPAIVAPVLLIIVVATRSVSCHDHECRGHFSPEVLSRVQASPSCMGLMETEVAWAWALGLSRSGWIWEFAFPVSAWVVLLRCGWASWRAGASVRVPELTWDRGMCGGRLRERELTGLHAGRLCVRAASAYLEYVMGTRSLCSFVLFT